MQRENFDINKAIEVLIYITTKVQDKYKALKVLYFADRHHLSKYGRLICADDYSAMEFGPVPSNTYDIIKVAAGMSNMKLQSDVNLLDAFEVNGNFIQAKRESNLNYLSETDIECLDQSINENKQLSFDQLKVKSHDAAYESVGIDEIISFEDLVNSLPNADKLAEYLEI